MQVRRLMTAAVPVLAAMAAAPVGAQAEVVARDARIDQVRALDGQVLYHRAGDDAAYRRVIDGRPLAADGVPAGAVPSAIGRDAAGRVVVTMVATEVRDRRVVDRDWWVYDIRRDRARALAVPDGESSPHAVAVWRKRLAYAASSTSKARSGVFLQEGGRTRRVSARPTTQAPLYLRGRVLLGVVDDGLGSTSIRRLDGEGGARRQLPGSSTTEEWSIDTVGTVGRTAVWWVSPNFGADAGGLVGVGLDGAARPGAVAVADGPASRRRAVALDGRWLYAADRKALRRHRVAKAPESGAPANDDVADATPIGADLPVTVTSILGNATTEQGDPTEETVWYRLKPAATRRVTLGTIATGFRVFVFEGDAIGALKAVPTSNADDDFRFDVVAGRTYSIAVAGPALGGDYEFARYVPFRLRLDAAKD